MYYRDILKYKPQKRKEELTRFCEKNIPDYNRAKHFKIINIALNKGKSKNQNLIRIEKLVIFKDEIEYINALDINYDYKKVLFAFLVHMRLNKIVYERKNQKEYTSVYFKGGRKKYQMIKSMSNTPDELKINEDVIYNLSRDENPLIASLYSGLITLNFLEECYQTGNVAIEIKDYQNVGWYFDWYNGVNKIALCECGKPFKQYRKDQVKCVVCREYQPIGGKILVCVDCGNNFIVDSKANNRSRCDECKIIKKRNDTYIRVNKIRNNTL